VQRIKREKPMRHIITCLALLVAVSTVRADVFAFDTVTTNSPNRQDIADQLFMDASVIGAGQSSVMFTNTGPYSSAITEIYFGSDVEPATLGLSIDSIISSSGGVDFTINGATPENPPGWEEFPFWWSVTIAAAESEPPPSQNGIDPLEYLELDLSYNGSLSLSQLLQLGQLQVALHVVNMGEGGEYSDTFVNDTTVVPEPASLLLLGTAGSFIAFMRRRLLPS
jgi:hypothetical protein